MFPITSDKEWIEAIKQSRLMDVKNAVTIYAGTVDTAGETGLMLAARLGYESLVRFLIPYEAGQFNMRGETALLIAMQAHKLKIVQILASREAHVQLERGGTALHYAITCDYLDSIPVLTRYLKDTPDPEGLLPLELAVQTENFPATSALLYYGQPHTIESLKRAQALLPREAGPSWTKEFNKYLLNSESNYGIDSSDAKRDQPTSAPAQLSQGPEPDNANQNSLQQYVISPEYGSDKNDKGYDGLLHSPTAEDYGALGATAATTAKTVNSAGITSTDRYYYPGPSQIETQQYNDDDTGNGDGTDGEDDIVEPDVSFPSQCTYSETIPYIQQENSYGEQKPVTRNQRSPSILTGELLNYETAIQQKAPINDTNYSEQQDKPHMLLSEAPKGYDTSSSIDAVINAKQREEQEQRQQRIKKAEGEDTRYQYFEKDIATLTASFSRNRTPNDVLQLMGSSTVIKDNDMAANKFVPDITASQRVVSPRASFRSSVRASSRPRSRSVSHYGSPDTDSSVQYSNVERAGSRLSGNRMAENLIKNLVTSRYMNGDTELIYSVKHKNFPMVDQLAPSQHGERDADGKTALLLAAERNNKPMIDVLSQYEAGMYDNDGWTALMRLSAQNAIDSVEALLGKETGMKRKSDGWTALMIAVLHASIDMVKIFAPYEVGMQADDGSTALILAIKADRPSVARYLFHKERYICDKDGISGEQWGINLNRSYIKSILAEEVRKREEEMDKKQRSKVLKKYVPRSRITTIKPRSPKRGDALSDGYRLPSIWLKQVD